MTTRSPYRRATAARAGRRRLGAIALLLCSAALARTPAPAPAPAPLTIELRLRNHLFEPSEIQIPAHTQVRLRVQNLDITPEEFASWELNRKKIVPGNHTAILYIGPLAPGAYPFFGEFNPKTAQGRLTAR